jgi:hypothetical protein
VQARLAAFGSAVSQRKKKKAEKIPLESMVCDQLNIISVYAFKRHDMYNGLQRVQMRMPVAKANNGSEQHS